MKFKLVADCEFEALDLEHALLQLSDHFGQLYRGDDVPTRRQLGQTGEALQRTDVDNAVASQVEQDQ